jgi:hypothetical protein
LLRTASGIPKTGCGAWDSAGFGSTGDTIEQTNKSGGTSSPAPPRERGGRRAVRRIGAMPWGCESSTLSGMPRSFFLQVLFFSWIPIRMI